MPAAPLVSEALVLTATLPLARIGPETGLRIDRASVWKIRNGTYGRTPEWIRRRPRMYIASIQRAESPALPQ